MNVGLGNACAMRTVEAPWPQPTSATVPPASSLPTTPSSAGSQVADQVRVVAGAEEPLAALEHVVGVLVPADARAGPRGLGDPGRVRDGAERDLEEAGQVRGAVGVGQRDAPARAGACSGRCRGRTRRSRRRPGRSATRGRSAPPRRCARRARPASSGPAPASARYRPSLSPITTSAALSVAPTSSTARNTNALSLSGSSAAGGLDGGHGDLRGRFGDRMRRPEHPGRAHCSHPVGARLVA